MRSAVCQTVIAGLLVGQLAGCASLSPHANEPPKPSAAVLPMANQQQRAFGVAQAAASQAPGIRLTGKVTSVDDVPSAPASIASAPPLLVPTAPASAISAPHGVASRPHADFANYLRLSELDRSDAERELLNRRFPSLFKGTVYESNGLASGLPSYESSLPSSLPAVTSLANVPGDNMVAEPSIGVSVDQQDGTADSVIIEDAPLDAGKRTFLSRFKEHPLVYNLVNDQRNFYRCDSLAWLAAGVGTAAIFANTGIDQQFRAGYDEHLRPGTVDLDWMKNFGEGKYVIPGLAAIWLVDRWIDSSCDGDEQTWAGCLEAWSGRSFRGLLVGAVPVVALQYVTGGSRPEEGNGSNWRPFTDTNGVSGHAYVGAVPFWTAAKMTDNVPLKIGFYGLGTMAGFSRVHNDAHYLSQVTLGWWIAYLSVRAVDATELEKRRWLMTPTLIDGAPAVAVIRQW